VASEPEALLQVLTNTIYRFKRVGLEAGPLSQFVDLLGRIALVSVHDRLPPALQPGIAPNNITAIIAHTLHLDFHLEFLIKYPLARRTLTHRRGERLSWPTHRAADSV
jgi:hypothetical protein